MDISRTFQPAIYTKIGYDELVVFAAAFLSPHRSGQVSVGRYGKCKLLRRKSSVYAAAFGREVRPGEYCAKRAVLAGGVFFGVRGAGGLERLGTGVRFVRRLGEAYQRIVTYKSYTVT